jgi:hypothetical protein
MAAKKKTQPTAARRGVVLNNLAELKMRIQLCEAGHVAAKNEFGADVARLRAERIEHGRRLRALEDAVSAMRSTLRSSDALSLATKVREMESRQREVVDAINDHDREIARLDNLTHTAIDQQIPTGDDGIEGARAFTMRLANKNAAMAKELARVQAFVKHAGLQRELAAYGLEDGHARGTI